MTPEQRTLIHVSYPDPDDIHERDGLVYELVAEHGGMIVQKDAEKGTRRILVEVTTCVTAKCPDRNLGRALEHAGFHVCWSPAVPRDQIHGYLVAVRYNDYEHLRLRDAEIKGAIVKAGGEISEEWHDVGITQICGFFKAGKLHCASTSASRCASALELLGFDVTIIRLTAEIVRAS